ncbi:phosphate ABC transporter, periplasmic phosphate-binding protein [Syntrophotalea carbinolica DSM 2380]|uniref:Phosphate-binding protein n=1 Tax=Syntrophotalea carbinolica (strain DSM 2380 / NBRC 103641 / GraBd1) TaxID=338963 RepID=Q3A6U3_SYNC1|nr:PstS family phosphate ABC transporter substrate-binding protein [Syntrophotalea carbinolica]ABA87914.1 phosphate ABC transporter, periplasmic phosphate-binding protein [Syntrophotalea carbinolica DSM 2380]
MSIKVVKGWKKAVGLALAAVVAMPLVASTGHAANIKVDPKLKSYTKVQGVSGNLNSIGSDTLNNLMALWSEGFRKQYPNVNIQVEGKGSSTAPPALVEGTSQIGPMSRKMKRVEIEAFEKKHGFKPTMIGVALDSLAVYVNKDNPVDSLSLPQVDAIFSKTRKGGHAQDIVTWGQVGLTGSWAQQPISVYGRNSASGTYGYFKKHALFKGDYKDIVKEQPGSASVVLSVTEDRGGIGYSGIGYKTSGVKAIALAKQAGGTAYGPTYENVLAGKYPLGRMLYLYVAKAPNKPLAKNIEQFLRYVLSKEGQEIVVKDGYLPLPAQVVAKQLEALK